MSDEHDELAELKQDGAAIARVELDRVNRELGALNVQRAQLEQAAGLADPEPWRGALTPASALGEGEWLYGGAPDAMPALLRLPASEGGGLFLPAGRVGLLVAPGGTGKTTLLVGLAVSVASGRAWLQTYPVTSDLCGRVLLILAEEDKAEVKRKLYDAVYGLNRLDRNCVASNVDVMALAGVPCPLLDVDPATGPQGAPKSSKFSAHLRALVEQAARDGRPYKLIVADPLSRLAGAADENDNNRATRLVQELEQLASVGERVSVIVAHHTNKGALNAGSTDQGAARGASALVDGARWVANLEPVRAPDGLCAGPDGGAGWGGARSVLRVTKSNYGPPTPALELFRPIGGSVRPATPDELHKWQESEAKHKAAQHAKAHEAAKAAKQGAPFAPGATSSLATEDVRW